MIETIQNFSNHLSLLDYDKIQEESKQIKIPNCLVKGQSDSAFKDLFNLEELESNKEKWIGNSKQLLSHFTSFQQAVDKIKSHINEQNQFFVGDKAQTIDFVNKMHEIDYIDVKNKITV